MKKTTTPRRAATMFPLVEQWQQQDQQTKKQFCAAHHLNVHTFDYWRNKYRRQSSRTGSDFISLQTDRPPPPTVPAAHLRYPNGVELHLASLPPATQLADLLQLLD